MKLSRFGHKFGPAAGINSLMEDLGNALAEGGLIMMGGGNPGFVPEVEDALRQRLADIASDPDAFRRLVGIYDPPQGEKRFIRALAGLLREQFGWPIDERYIALTNGSQSAFFTLFNLFGGDCGDGEFRKILLPMAPEYIGYADAGLQDDLFISVPPLITELPDNRFKYHVDFSALPLEENIGAICVSRPTNPTGNVLTDAEMDHLIELAREQDVPLIVDGAYGLPFPGLIFTPVKEVWDDHLVLCLSLSKFGLPAARTGIVIAHPDVIKAVSAVNAITNLAPGSFGATLATELVESGEILRLSQDVVRPFYQRKAERAAQLMGEALAGLPFALHVPEGAMFLWLWLKDLPVSSLELYQQLKDEGVLVVSGHYFFPGLDLPDWKHQHECLRITYSQEDELVSEGITRLAALVRRVYGESGAG